MDNRIERIRQSFFPRKIEENDTHDSIHRHDPEFQKRKNRHHDDWQDHEDDMADISVESLIVFLEGLIGETQSQIIEEDEPMSKMEKAAQAYASHAPEQKKTLGHNIKDDPYGGKIVSLIQKLNDLNARGCSHVDLMQGESFLDSIEKTVEKYHVL